MNFYFKYEKGGGRVDGVLNQQQLEALCDVLGHTNNGFTKKELTRLLQKSGIELVDDGSLYNCLANEINTSHSLNKIYIFLETAFDPVSFTDEEKRDKYNYILESSNKVLLLAGITITLEGKLKK